MDDRSNVLRAMQICRFCLDDGGPFTNIYRKDGKQSIPLPLQIMACVAIEVFENDGMPQLICDSCRTQTLQAYTFKTTCKKSDDTLKIFLATGNMFTPLKSKSTIDSKEFDASTKVPQKRAYTPSEEETIEEKKPKTHIQSPSLLSNITHPIQTETESAINAIEDDNKTNVDKQQFNENTEEDEDGEESNLDDSQIRTNEVLTDIFPCPDCDRSFPLQQLLDLHYKNHSRERTFECEHCARKFFTKYDLAKHVQTHSDDKPFSCVVCNKQFSRESLLHRHEKIHIDVPKYLCTTCDKTFLTKEDLDVHTEKHKKKRPFVCRICNKSFVFKQGLERHELIHADEKPHKCNYCEASFTSAIKLMRHITSHAGLRPYPCKICGRTFLLSHHLTRHMRSHYAAKSPLATPVGQYKCDVCSMSFRRKDSLINHSAIHSMVNLKCVICNTAFQNAKQVKDHITIHLSGLPYPCDKCDYSFESQDQLEEHEVKHAQMEYEEQIEQEVVKEEAEQAQFVEGEEYSGDEFNDFTITCETGVPEIVRRSKREPKIKNYAQFLNDELGSDMEEESGEFDKEKEELDETEVTEIETIKPIIRMEGTKVYQRKGILEKPKISPPEVSPTQVESGPIDQINQPQIALENLGLSKQLVHGLPNKQYVNVKIGEKLMRVQKLIVTKAEMEAMAKEGKLEFQGDNILVKMNHGKLITSTSMNSPLKAGVNIENVIETNKTGGTAKIVVKKTYTKKPNIKAESIQEASTSVEEVPSQ